MMRRSNVFPDIAPVPKQRVSALLAAGWARVAAAKGKGRLADAVDATEKTIENAMAGRTLPELHTALNSLLIDPTALDELLRAFGYRLIPYHAAAANDLSTAAGVIDAMAELVKSHADGHRDHNETLAVAALLRPHMAAVEQIIREADQIRGAA